jgi:hypothetical protein
MLKEITITHSGFSAQYITAMYNHYKQLLSKARSPKEYRFRKEQLSYYQRQMPIIYN